MRLFVLILWLLPLPAAAWEVTIGPVCTLVHETDTARVTLTHDPGPPRYTITVTRRDAPWSPAGVFGMRFDGPRPGTISTDRHVAGDGGASLTVTDRGFGNVLDGLQFNRTATAFTSAGETVTLPLDGAAQKVQLFRECRPEGLV